MEPTSLQPYFLLLLLILFEVFFSFPHTHAIQAHIQQELTKDELLCVSTSQEESALGRWLECLKSSSVFSGPESPEDFMILDSASEEANTLDSNVLGPANLPDSTDEEMKIPLLESHSSEESNNPHSESLIDASSVTKLVLMDSAFKEDFLPHAGTPMLDKDSVQKVVILDSSFELQGHDQEKMRIMVEMRNPISEVNAKESFKLDHSQEELGNMVEMRNLISDVNAKETFKLDHGQEEMGNMVEMRNPISGMNAKESFKLTLAELSNQKNLPSRDCDGNGDRKLKMEKTRDGEIEVHSLSAWLQLNLELLVLTKCLLAMSRAFKRLLSKNRKWDGSSNTYVEENNIEAVCEMKKSQHLHCQSPKWHARTDYIPTLGGPIGTAVGAVFAEVLLTTSKCGPSVPADKISMLFKTAFKDSVAMVVGECESLQILDEFLASFKTTYITICRVHETCLQSMKLSHNKTMEVESMHQEPDVGELSFITRKFSNESRHTESPSPKPVKLVDSTSCGGTDNLDTIIFSEVFNDVALSSAVNLKPAKHRESNTHGRADNLDVTKGSQAGTDCGMSTTVVDGIKLNVSDSKTNQVSLLSEKMESLVLGDNRISSSPKDTCTMVEDIIVNKLQGITLNATLHSDNDFVQEDPTPSLTNNGFSSNVIDGISIKDKTLLLAYNTEDVTELDYSSEYSSNFCQELSNVNSELTQCSGAMSLVQRKYRGEDQQKPFLSVLERYVQAQEQRNHIKTLEVAHLLKQRVLEEEKIHLTSVSNDLMREHILLNKSKVSFKENTILEQKANCAYANFSTTCADELVAGLFIMLASLVYGVRKYSFTLLSDLVSSCKPVVVKETRRTLGFNVDWLYNSLDSLVGKLQSFLCHITVAGRILVGSIVVAVVASSLLRRSVTSSSQAMPATILIIVLGGVCGFAGKLSVDSLGGNGIKWLVMWELFCILHALTNCFTPFVYNLLHGSHSNATKWRIGIPFWFRRLFFHFLMVLMLPILAGQLPFGTFGHVMNELMLSCTRAFIVIFSSISEMMPQMDEGTYKLW